MLKIRLQRVGKRGQAYFRVVLVEHTTKPKGAFLELLGSYDPHKKELKIDKERVEYWMSKGAGISPTVNNLMVNYKYWDRPKMASWKPKPSAGAQAEKKEGVAGPETVSAPKGPQEVEESSRGTPPETEKPAGETT